MQLDTMLAKAKNAKEVKNEFLDEVISFMPEACNFEAIEIVQSAVRLFKNCASYLSNWFSVDGEGRHPLHEKIVGERVYFASELRRPKKETGLNNHDRVFMSVVFLDEAPTYEFVNRIDRNPHDLMYEQARRFQCEGTDFLFATIGLLTAIQDKGYTFFDVTELDTSELILIFHSKTCRYKCVTVMLNYKVLQMDADLLEAFGATENDVYRPSADDDDWSGPHQRTYIH